MCDCPNKNIAVSSIESNMLRSSTGLKVQSLGSLDTVGPRKGLNSKKTSEYVPLIRRSTHIEPCMPRNIVPEHVQTRPRRRHTRGLQDVMLEAFGVGSQTSHPSQTILEAFSTKP